METLDCIAQRSSTRAFTQMDVPTELLEKLFLAARWAPSAVNTQPWQVHVLKADAKNALSHALLAERNKNAAPRPDYNYYPTDWFDPYSARRKACGKALYSQLDITYGDAEKRLVQWNLNYVFFHAPVGLIFTLDEKLAKGSWLDMGMFLQNVMLAAEALELGTCAQASIAEYPDIVREQLQLPRSQHIVCGMALGYPDNSNKVNQYRTERGPLSEFVQWHQ